MGEDIEQTKGTGMTPETEWLAGEWTETAPIRAGFYLAILRKRTFKQSWGRGFAIVDVLTEEDDGPLIAICEGKTKPIEEVPVLLWGPRIPIHAGRIAWGKLKDKVEAAFLKSKHPRGG